MGTLYQSQLFGTKSAAQGGGIGKTAPYYTPVIPLA